LVLLLYGSVANSLLLSSFALRFSSRILLLFCKVAVTTASLAIALPMSIAVFPQEASFKSDSLEPEFQDLRLKDDSRREVAYLYANKGL
ncbi:unnamed protein product, partial [Laminaria digitata]